MKIHFPREMFEEGPPGARVSPYQDWWGRQWVYWSEKFFEHPEFVFWEGYTAKVLWAKYIELGVTDSFRWRYGGNGGPWVGGYVDPQEIMMLQDGSGAILGLDPVGEIYPQGWEDLHRPRDIPRPPMAVILERCENPPQPNLDWVVNGVVIQNGYLTQWTTFDVMEGTGGDRLPFPTFPKEFFMAHLELAGGKVWVKFGNQPGYYVDPTEARANPIRAGPPGRPLYMSEWYQKW